MRLVDADHVRRVLKETAKECTDASVVYALFLVLDAIDEAPTYDPENVVINGEVRCSSCGSTYTYTSNEKLTFCPYCGAKNEGRR